MKTYIITYLLFIATLITSAGSLKWEEPKLNLFLKHSDHMFVGKIIDESFKSLKIKGEYFVKTPANTDFFYGGVLEIY